MSLKNQTATSTSIPSSLVTVGSPSVELPTAQRLRIGLDVDDVIVDFLSAFTQEAEIVLGRRFEFAPKFWDCHDWGITQDQKNQVLYTICKTDNWYFNNCVALPGIPEYLPWLTQVHDVFFITSRLETAGLPTLTQTQMHLSELGVQFPTVLMAHDKGQLAGSLGLDVFVDDKPDNLCDIQSCGVPNLFLMNKSYNEQLDESVIEWQNWATEHGRKRWTRVDSFKQFIDHLENIE